MQFSKYPSPCTEQAARCPCCSTNSCSLPASPHSMSPRIFWREMWRAMWLHSQRVLPPSNGGLSLCQGVARQALWQTWVSVRRASHSQLGILTLWVGFEGLAGTSGGNSFVPSCPGANGIWCPSAACLPGHYGMGCARRCHCPAGTPCHHLTGECSCPPGFTGHGCKKSKS